MSVTINGTTGIAGVDGSASTPAYQGADTNTGIAFPAADTVSVATGGTERMRVDSSGNVGIGTSSPTDTQGFGKALDVQGSTGAAVYVGASGDRATLGYASSELQIRNPSASGTTRFYVNSTERARINSSGYFKASNNGTYVSSTNIFHELVQSSGNQWNTIISNSASSGTLYGTLLSYTGQSPNNTTSEFFRCEDTTNNKLTIYSSGTVTNRTGTYNSFSDLKLKQDVVDAGSQWSDIKSLRVVNYRLKDEVAADPNYPSYIGLIAQEVEQVSPGLVDECPDVEINENGEHVPTGTSTKAVKYSILYMKAVKALQEAMERIETLEAKVTALEAKNV